MTRVVLDGYNLILRAGGDAGERGRSDLVLAAARYRGGRQVEMTIVFDSRTPMPRPEPGRPGVKVVFARGDADTAILDLVRKAKAPREMLVVTSDRRLASAARDLGADIETAEQFRARADRRRDRSRTKVTCAAPLSEREVADWLALFQAPREKE